MAVCANCGAALTATARFCPSCGTAAASATPPGRPTAADHRESRRTVSILFADVVGSTELAEALDPETVRRHMRAWFSTAQQTIERHGGTVEKFIGDAVMAVFGVPIIHEDDALRAARVAVELRDADHGPLTMRIGVTTGEVVAGDPGTGQTFVTGDPVNTAARLQAAAAPGTVVIDQATQRRISAAATSEPLPPMVVKGKREPVAAYRLEAVDPEGQAIARRLDGPMVGRSPELSRLREALESVQNSSSTQVVTVVGQPGIGKSRLVHEFLAGARREATVLRSRCLPYGEGITYLPVAELIREAAGVTRDDGPDRAVERVSRLAKGIDRAPLIAAQLLALVGLGDEVGAPREAAWAMRRMLERLAEARTVVVVVDDIQWAESSALELLEHVADRARTSPILLVCMARPELDEVHPTWMRDRDGASTVRLQPLSTDEGAQLVDALLGGLPLALGARERIAIAADGNPLFIEQLLAMLQDDGLLVREAGQWVARGDLTEFDIPPSIAALLAARIDRLPSAERVTLERASVVGKSFSMRAVTDLASEPGPGTVASHLEALAGKELVVPDASPMTGDAAFRFRHLLVRDAAYAGISKAERARLHERFADRLEERDATHGSEIQLVLGYHLEQAHRYRVELGDEGAEVSQLARRAVAYLAPAGEAAYDRGDIRAAVPLLHRSVDLAEPDEPRRGRSLYVLARALRAAGEHAESIRAIELAREAQRRHRDPGLDYRIRIFQAVAARDRGGAHASELWALAQEALDDAERRGDGSDMLNALHYLGEATLELEGLVAEEPIHLRIVALARELGFDGRADRALGIIANRLWAGPTPVAEALDRLSWMLGEIREDVMARALVHLSIGACQAMDDRIDEARLSLETARQIGEDVGEVLPLLAHDWPAFVSFVERKAGDPSRAEPIARWSCKELARVDDPYHLSGMLMELASLLMAQGRSGEVPELIERARAVTSPSDPVAQLYLDVALAELLILEGRSAEAIELARTAVAELSRWDETNGQIEASLVLAKALRGSGDEPAAQAAAEEARQLAATKQDRAAVREIEAFLLG